MEKHFITALLVLILLAPQTGLEAKSRHHGVKERDHDAEERDYEKKKDGKHRHYSKYRKHRHSHSIKDELKSINKTIADIQTEMAALGPGLKGDTGVKGDTGETGATGAKGDPGLQGLPGIDAPDRTAELCDLYQILIDRSLIGVLAIPEFCPSPPSYEVGDAGPGDGIVFYLTPNTGGLHGLEAAPADQGEAQWGCSGEPPIAGADGTTIGTGLQNTADILAGCIPNAGIAADLASGDILSNGFSDWFLPSKDELNKLYMNKAVVGVVGVFASDIYWSSSQVDDRAWVQIFSNGIQGPSGKLGELGVRAVRAF